MPSTSYQAQLTAALATVNTRIAPNGTRAITGQVHQDNERFQMTDTYGNLVAYDNFAYCIVRTTGVAATDGTALQAAYTNAKTMTPGGSALSATNRAAVLLPPGVYSLGTSPLLVNAQFVDFVGLGDPSDVVITSIVNTSSGSGTINKSVNDVRFVNLTIRNTAATLSSFGATDDAAFAPQAAYAAEVFDNCIFADSGSGNGVGMRMGVEYAGTYKNCVCNAQGAFGAYTSSVSSGVFVGCSSTVQSFGDTASGYFLDCTSSSGNSFGTLVASGAFFNCRVTGGSSNGGFGNQGNATGVFTRCTAGNGSFGATLSSGSFFTCVGGDNAFSVTASGVYVDCVGGDTSFGTTGSGVASGQFYGCRAGSNSFGTSLAGVATASGTFRSCIAGDVSFGYGAAGSTASGTFIACEGGQACFASAGDGVASGIFISCRALDNAFGSAGEASGTFQDCVAGANSYGVAGVSGGEASGVFRNCYGTDYCFGSGGGTGGAGIASGQFYGCVAGIRSFGGYFASADVSGTASGAYIDCIGGTESFGGGGAAGLMSGYMNNCKLMTDGAIGADAHLGVVTGKMERCNFTMTGSNRTAVLVGAGAKVSYCTLIGTGTGYSVDGANGTTASIWFCSGEANGINATNITNAIGTANNVFDADVN